MFLASVCDEPSLFSKINAQSLVPQSHSFEDSEECCHLFHFLLQLHAVEIRGYGFGQWTMMMIMNVRVCSAHTLRMSSLYRGIHTKTRWCLQAMTILSNYTRSKKMTGNVSIPQVRVSHTPQSGYVSIYLCDVVFSLKATYKTPITEMPLNKATGKPLKKPAMLYRNFQL